MNDPDMTPLAEADHKSICEELSRRAKGGAYILLLDPAFETKDTCVGVYYKVPNTDGIAKILGHTLMWFLTKPRTTDRAVETPTETP